MRAERELVSIQERPTIVEFVNNFHLGGTEGQAVELLRGLAERFQPRAAAIHLAGAHLPAVRALGLEPFEVPLAGSVARAHTLAQIARLAGYLRRERVQLVHAHDFYTALLAVPAAKLARTAVIVGRLDLAHWHGPVQRLALAAATRGADHVVANAEAIKRQLLERERLPEERITVIRNGIDLACFDRAQKHALEAPLPPLEGRLVIAHVANMTHPVKAHEDLFEAVRWLKARHPEILVLLVGDGARRAHLEALAGQAGLRGQVEFLGHRGDVPAILARCDLGVLCSHAEGLSNAIIEGMAARLPMVVTDAGGDAELVKDGARGFVVPVRAPLALSARLCALAEAPELRVRMGEAGRGFVESELTVQTLLRRHEALYLRVIEQRAGKQA